MKKIILSISILFLIILIIPRIYGSFTPGFSGGLGFGCNTSNTQIILKSCGPGTYFYEKKSDKEKILYVLDIQSRVEKIKIEINPYFDDSEDFKSYSVTTFTGIKYDLENVIFNISPKYINEQGTIIYRDIVGTDKSDFLGYYLNGKKIFSFVDYENSNNYDTEQGGKDLLELESILGGQENYDLVHNYYLSDKTARKIDVFVDNLDDSKTESVVEKLEMMKELYGNRITKRDDIRYEIVRYLHLKFIIKKILNTDGVVGYLDYFENIR